MTESSGLSNPERRMLRAMLGQPTQTWSLEEVMNACGWTDQAIVVGAGHGLSNKGFVSINELAITIANLLGFELDPIYKEGRPQEVLLANCSADKARKLFGYESKVKLKDGLQTMIDYIKRRGTKPFKYHLDLEIISEITPETWKNKLF